MEVIVAGGGVSGTATAIALRRTGSDVTLYETHPDPAGQVGSFLSLASNGLRGLKALGCLDQVRQAGFAVATQRMWSGTGRLLAEVPRGRLSGDPLHSTTLMRGSLVEVLRECAAQAGVRIVTGRRLVGAEPAGNGIRALFADGPSVRADLLVGADGLWSAIRSVLDPGAPRPAYGGLYSVSGIAGGVPAETGAFNMIFARSGAFLHIPAPDGTVWWSAQVADPRPPDLTGVGDDWWLERLAELYRFEPQALEIIRATTQLHRPTLMHTLAEVPVWHDERVVLVGDAAHPVGAGQGASMAIEDAVVLARVLAEAGSTGEGLAEYDRLRRARIGKMAKAARTNRDAKTSGPLARRLRDLVMPIAFGHFYEKATTWLYAHDLGTLPAQAEESRPAEH
ncbi:MULTISPECIES: FAD-dependent oxidoreductase [unclassified Rhodococcus (in: high G+C Gram-positive bacteria)]|uniref:FAD-dependent oxidoreductase n=1 Tax=unclassified Rhodococcus (in: high G+C Gram-positive bacteria) TaxID=192944 RepID=UPI00077A0BC9|nr:MULTISPECIES: NAD(P)/FAD-dependent oxidoreductase [unclassified Rhodococcus (in: high G+C Gram-positive bacteria)]KXX56635.1 salicylate 1-monooxygenase [Rhodococcus sp. LB1]PBC54713.1 FAD-dependent monooxygenase [Rhodococcus sp. ACPA1]RZK86154.1 MAG: FAD-dependent monooxygenase [Rhodococcus sp. (in: high G+C Gram-positive bacteria)]